MCTCNDVENKGRKDFIQYCCLYLDPLPQKINVSIVVATKMRASENKLVTDSQFLFIYFISSDYRYMIQ